MQGIARTGSFMVGFRLASNGRQFSMRGRTAFISLLAVLLLPVHGWATLIVDPPQPITQRVTVQVIQTATTDGLTMATIFGSASQEANIKTQIDKIWAQAGIDIDFLPTVTSWNNTFAYQGNVVPPAARPDSDLDSIINLASSAGKLNATATVLNVFFVEVVPHFTLLPENTSAGFAKIGGNGISFTVGSDLPTFQNGRDVVAAVLAHEIGHNLGLSHTSDVNNLMYSGSTPQLQQKLTASQISNALNSSFSIDLPSLLGDYNQNDVIDAADYTVWRDALTAGSTTLPNDPTPGSVTESDFTYWRDHFGDQLGSGGGSGGDNLGLLGGGRTTVPEPATLNYLAMALAVLGLRRLRRSR
jgi:Matrixin/PEP-CTERM motif